MVSLTSCVCVNMCVYDALASRSGGIRIFKMRKNKNKTPNTMSDIQVCLKDDLIPYTLYVAHREFQWRFNMFKSNTFVL